MVLHGRVDLVHIGISKPDNGKDLIKIETMKPPTNINL